MAPERLPRIAALFVLLLAWSAAPSAAAGIERYGDITVSIGDAAGPATAEGYVSLPVVISNDGARARRVGVRVPERSYGGGSDHLSSLRRDFEVEPGGTVRGELLLPPLELSGNNAAAVSVDGVTQRDAVSVAVTFHSVGSPGLLVSGTVDRAVRSRLEAAVEAYNDGTTTGGYRGGSGQVSATTAEPVEQWSRSWLGYTGFAAVLVTGEDLRRMPAAVAAALRGWVFSGGQLVVLGADADAALAGAAEGLGRVTGWGPDAPERTDDAAAERFLGEALGFADAAAEPMDAGSAESAFPVVEGLTTPVRGLVLLMLLFAVLIGPVNILLLSYLKRRMWLLWTVPLGSAVFSLGVVAFAFLSEGIAPKARTQAVTYLDQTTQQAVTIGMRGYYAPLTPGDGLRFPMTTKVVAQVDRHGWGDGGRGRSVDLTAGQHLTRGWVAARVPTHLELTDVTQTRLRLDVEELPGGGVAVTNGLGEELTNLRLVGRDGGRFVASVVAAGERVELKPTAGGGDGGLWDDDFRREGWKLNLELRSDPWVALTPGMFSGSLGGSVFLADGIDGLAEHRVDAVVLGRYAPAGGGS